jgi:putative ABC transport system permease protein
MLKNIFVMMTRTMMRSWIVTTLIVGSLSVTFVAITLISIFIHNKYHAESFIPASTKIFLVATSVSIKDQPTISIPFSAPEIAGILKADISDIEEVTRSQAESDVDVSAGNIRAIENVIWVDPNYFFIFKFKVLHGNIDSAFQNPENLVITRKIAQKYFGKDNAVGNLLQVHNQKLFRITSVIEDAPLGSSFSGGIYASSESTISPIKAFVTERVGHQFDISQTGTIQTFVAIKDEQFLPSLTSKILSIEALKSRYPQVITVTLSFVGINDLKLKMPGTPNTAQTLISALILIGFLIVLVSGINFVNLIISKASDRRKEVGIRKVEGAAYYQIMIQFLIEAVMYVLIALIVGFIFLMVTLPYWSELLSQAFRLTSNLQLVGWICFGALCFALIAGSYPAFVMSSLPLKAGLLNFGVKSRSARKLREILVALQFAVVIAICICATVMTKQIEYSTKGAFAFDTTRTLVFRSNCSKSFAEEVLKLSNVSSLFCSSSAPYQQFSLSTNGGRRSDGSDMSIFALIVDFRFFNFYGIRPVAGRVFSEEHVADSLGMMHKVEGVVTPLGLISIVINKSAVKRMGYANPEDAVGNVVRGTLPDSLSGRIIGVVPDFVVGPAHDEVKPLVFFINDQKLQLMTVTIAANDNELTSTAIGRIFKEYEKANYRPVLLGQYFKTLYRDVETQLAAFETMFVISLVIACLGLLGLAIFNVRTRLREIGLRKAMGAGNYDITIELFVLFVRPILLSNLIAWPIAYFWLEYWLQGFSRHVDINIVDYVYGSAYPTAFVTCFALTYAWSAAKENAHNLLRNGYSLG